MTNDELAIELRVAERSVRTLLLRRNTLRAALLSVEIELNRATRLLATAQERSADAST